MKTETGRIQRRSSGLTSLSQLRSRRHLRSNSTVYKQDSAYALLERQRAQAWDSVPIGHSERLKYKSLKKGLLIRPDGTEFTDDEFDAHLDALCRTRNKYKRETYDHRDGRTRIRWQPHSDPVVQIPINFRPDHSVALSKLDQANFFVREPIKEMCAKLGRDFQEMSGYDVQAVTVHPEGGNLHCHIIYSVIGVDGTLLHARGQPGRHGIRTAGMGLIGALRLADQGVLPEDYVARLTAYLEARYTLDSQPYDYLLSAQLDAEVEGWAAKHERRGVGDHCLGEVFAEANRTWVENLKQRIEERMRRNPSHSEMLLRQLMDAVEREEEAFKKGARRVTYKTPEAKSGAGPSRPPILQTVMEQVKRHLAYSGESRQTEVAAPKGKQHERHR